MYYSENTALYVNEWVANFCDLTDTQKFTLLYCTFYYRFWQLNSSFWQLTSSRWQMNSSCWQMNSSHWLLNSSLWLLNLSLWHENTSLTRLAAGVNTKTRCSSCVIILFKYNCCKQLLRDNSSATASSAALATLLRH